MNEYHNNPIEHEEPVWTAAASRLPLLTGQGRSFPGLEHSSCPPLAEELKALFHHLDGVIGFPDSPAGRHATGSGQERVGVIHVDLAGQKSGPVKRAPRAA